jgi:hypothetical protein
MKNAWSFIDGKKMYLLAVFVLFLWLGLTFHWWTQEDIGNLEWLLAAFGLFTFRSAMKKLE